MATGTGRTGTRTGPRAVARLTTETKHSSKTTELYAMVAVIAGILIAALVIDSDGGTDYFRANDAWLYVSIVAVGYMISRGLAKSGSRERYWSDLDDLNDN